MEDDTTPSTALTYRIEAKGTAIRSPRRRGRASDIRRTGVTEYWIGTVASVCLDVGGPDHLAPLLSVVCEELAEVRRRTSQQRTAEFDQPCL